MEIIDIKPEKELKSLFYIYMTPVFIPAAVLAAVLMFAEVDPPGTVIIPLFMGLFLLIAFLLAIWIPAFYRSLEYSIDDDAIRCNSGVFWKRRVTVPYSKVTNVDITQGPVQRMYGVGSVHVQTAGAGGAQGGMAELAFMGVRNLEGVREAIMTRVKTRAGSAPRPVEAERAAPGDTQDRILAELKAIRAALEKRG
ncbi:MAG: membrane-flanked domain protein [Elusimicrobia bacterium]|nr:MAG: membrane-flanked domain protein [Elusimicrobiota bacterium]KAF0151840.1 MAG: membrane-flanked domain protein [Elusimicrobiota bacterium]